MSFHERNFCNKIAAGTMARNDLQLWTCVVSVNRKIQRQIQRENAKLISCIVQKESFYNEREMSAHEEAFMKYRKLRSGQGRQTEMYVFDSSAVRCVFPANGRPSHARLRTCLFVLQRYLGRQKNRKTRKKKKPPRSFKDSLKASYALAKEPTARLKFRDNWAKEVCVRACVCVVFSRMCLCGGMYSTGVLGANCRLKLPPSLP